MPRGASGRTREGQAATAVVLDVFRANGLLLRSGDLLARDEGLTSARWQVLGALALAGRPLTVPQIARRMGLARQSVHATVGRLVDEGLLRLAPNEDHERSYLVTLTERGQAKYRAMDRRQAAWVNRVARGLGNSNLAISSRTLDELCRRLEAEMARAREAGEAEERGTG